MSDDTSWKILLTVFNAVFLAGLGGMAQLTTLLYAADAPAARWTVFLGATAAMLASAALAVLAGAWIAHHLPMRLFYGIAGAAFIGIGMWSLRHALL